MRRIAVLTHPGAGRGRGGRAREIVLPRLRDAGIEVVDLVGATAEESAALAARAVRAATPPDALVAIGGDGTVQLALQCAAAADMPLGIIPAGTGNDLARELGLPSDAAAAADRVIASRAQRIDLLVVGERRISTVLACGFDALVAARADAMRWPRGPVRYVAATAVELRRLRPRRYVITADGVEHVLDGVLAAVGNTQSFGGGLRITEGARIDDGELDVVIIGSLDRRALVRAFGLLRDGSHTDHPAYHHLRARTVTIAAAPGGVVAYGDGEAIAPLPVTVRIEPAAVQVLV